jgi:hypothetical protein
MVDLEIIDPGKLPSADARKLVAFVGLHMFPPVRSEPEGIARRPPLPRTILVWAAVLICKRGSLSRGKLMGRRAMRSEGPSCGVIFSVCLHIHVIVIIFSTNVIGFFLEHAATFICKEERRKPGCAGRDNLCRRVDILREAWVNIHYWSVHFEKRAPAKDTGGKLLEPAGILSIGRKVVVRAAPMKLRGGRNRESEMCPLSAPVCFFLRLVVLYLIGLETKG